MEDTDNAQPARPSAAHSDAPPAAAPAGAQPAQPVAASGSPRPAQPAASGNPRPTGESRPGSAQGAQPAQPSAGALEIILASASPRRRDLLEQAGVAFTVRTAEVDEALDEDLAANPAEAAKKLAERKAGAIVQEILAQQEYTGTAVVIGADTMVVQGGEIFGKPRSLSDATRMLRRFSGVTHEVMTGVSVWMIMAPEPEKVSVGFRSFVDTSAVTFRELTDQEIADYLRKGESFDKAGAYAAQGAGADLIARIDGSLDTVIGLPVERLLREFPDLRA